jgi:hypothetical protein
VAGSAAQPAAPGCGLTEFSNGELVMAVCLMVVCLMVSRLRAGGVAVGVGRHSCSALAAARIARFRPNTTSLVYSYLLCLWCHACVQVAWLLAWICTSFHSCLLMTCHVAAHPLLRCDARGMAVGVGRRSCSALAAARIARVRPHSTSLVCCYPLCPGVMLACRCHGCWRGAAEQECAGCST